MRQSVKGIDRKAIRDMRKQGSDRCGTVQAPRASREILRDPFTLTWFVAYAVATGLVILALLT